MPINKDRQQTTRLLTIVLGAARLIWLPFEDTHLVWINLFAMLISSLMAFYAAGKISPEKRQRWYFYPAIGVLAGLVAVLVALGGQPQAWIAQNQSWNNLFLIVIVIWLQTGYAMVLFSAALKGIPGEILEAARVDGANELQVFSLIMVPSIRGTIIAVSTTVVIFTLKIFDVVLVMTGGQYGTDVIATQF